MKAENSPSLKALYLFCSVFAIDFNLLKKHDFLFLFFFCTQLSRFGVHNLVRALTPGAADLRRIVPTHCPAHANAIRSAPVRFDRTQA
jgi:hypothetical protein